MNNSILVAVDFSPITESLVQEGVSMARAFASELHLLHVMPPEISGVTDLMMCADSASFGVDLPVSCHEDQVLAIQSLRDQLSAIAVGVEGVPCHTHLLRGDPVDVVLEQIALLDVRMVLLGSHGHGVIYDALVGSVSAGLLRRAKCPVLVLPSKSL